MPKNDNVHALRLLNAICRSTGCDAADAFGQMHPLSKSADINKKFQWACDICASLESRYQTDEAVHLRRACRCGDGKTMAHEIACCIRKAGNLSDGCTLFSRQNGYAFLEYVSDHELIFGYHSCVCSCIKRAAGTVPALWCECSAGYAEAMFQQLFDAPVQVTLLGTVKSGAARCTFRIQW